MGLPAIWPDLVIHIIKRFSPSNGWMAKAGSFTFQCFTQDVYTVGVPNCK